MNTLWTNIFAQMTPQSLLRINYLLRANDRYLLVRERNLSHGNYRNWLYMVDEWCFLADCMGIYEMQRYYGVPVDAKTLEYNTLSNIEFCLNNTTLFERVQGFRYFDAIQRDTTNGIDCIHLFLEIELGVGDILVDLEPQHFSVFCWANKQEALQINDLMFPSIMQQVLQ